MDRSRPPLHIGIVGCSAEGAALCYRTICAEAAARLGPHVHPEVSMHTPSLAEYVACLERDDLDGVAALMLASARKLASIGAELLICPDNTIHQAWSRVVPRTPRPWLHIAEVVAEAAVQRGWQRLGLTGTRWLVDSPVYPDVLGARGLACVRPALEDRLVVDRIIMDELVPGQVSVDALPRFQAVVARLRDAGCEAVILGCTELPLLADGATLALPTLDSTRLLARAALQRAVDGAAFSDGRIGARA